MQPPLVGRANERAELDRFVRGVADTPGAMVLEGPAGIGKSALWNAAVEAASSAGVRVLAARPTGAETGFAYQSLADLLTPALPEVAGSVPGVQRHALELALHLVEARSASVDGTEPEGHAQVVAMAATTVLLLLARISPVLIAIDDAPWLDPATTATLTFAARRLAGHRVSFLVAQRVDEPTAAPLELDQAIPNTQRLALGPLSLGALHLLLAERLGLTLPRPILTRLQAVAQGNPFHALEIGRALQRLASLPRPGDPLPIPESIGRLIRERLEPVPAAARHVLLVASASGSGSASEIAAVVGAETFTDGLDAAVDAGLLVLDGPDVRFTHPLIASTVHEGATSAERRTVHASLAAVVGNPESRARHLALAGTGPDADIADALDAAAEDARRRGATEASAELLRLAVERTPDAEVDILHRRGVRLAEALLELPDLAAAQTVLDRTIPELGPGPLRAQARWLAGTISWYVDQATVAVDRLLAAIPDAAGDRMLLGRIHYRLAIFFDFDLAQAASHAATAVELLGDEEPSTTFAGALFQLFYADILLGRAPRTDLLERGLRAEGKDNASDRSTIPGVWWLAIDRPDLARDRFGELLDEARTTGNLAGEADLLTRFAEAAVYADEWPVARELAAEARMAAHRQGQTAADPARRAVALADAHEGRLDEARAACTAALARVEATGDHIIAVAYLQVLALVASSAAEYDEVDRLASASAGHLAAIGCAEPMRLDATPEWIEALVALGRLADAEDQLAPMEERGRTFPRPWVDAAVARGRALLLAAQGDLAAALAATDPATDERSDGWRRFDRARTLLVRGGVLRQQRARREAAAVLEDALATFQALGAAVWARRAEAELERLGRHRPGTDELTPSERRVAELAASGLRNREVAAQLHVSPKTVEAHLARIYEKLGIRSRAELGRRMAEK